MIQRSVLQALSCVTISLATVSSVAPSQYLPIYGGSGGTAFTRDCGAGKVLTGLRARVGMVVDAVGLLCRTVNSNGTLGSENTVGTLAGGGGGNTVVTHCDAGEVVHGGVIYHGSFVDGLSVHCRPWVAGTRAVNTTPGSSAHPYLARIGNTGSHGPEHCEFATQPASGIRGRASALVDAFGFICDEP